MNIKETIEAIKVMQAFVDGKKVTNTRNPHWNWAGCLSSYEIKPEPFECYLWFLRKTPLNGDNSVSFKSIEHAMQYLVEQGEGKVFHMKQVEQ